MSRNEEILAGMREATERIAPAVTHFGEQLRALDIRVGMHNYEGFEGEPVLLVVARGRRADEVEKFVDGLLGDDWQADSQVSA